MKKWPMVLFFHCLLMGVLLTSCQERPDLAPVTELKWQPFNKKAGSYRVRAGDTLYAVAFRYDMDVGQVAQMNHLRPPYSLREGQIINLHPAPQSRVRKTVAKLFHPVKKIKKKPYVEKKYTASNTSWLWPVKGALLHTFNPAKGKKGIDINGKKNMPVRASASGIVAYAGNGLPGYGNLILLKHFNHYLTAYGFNATVKVKEGEKIKAGQVIAYMGKIDKVRWGLHFEIRKEGKPINPLKYLKNG